MILPQQHVRNACFGGTNTQHFYYTISDFHSKNNDDKVMLSSFDFKYFNINITGAIIQLAQFSCLFGAIGIEFSSGYFCDGDRSVDFQV